MFHGDGIEHGGDGIEQGKGFKYETGDKKHNGVYFEECITTLTEEGITMASVGKGQAAYDALQFLTLLRSSTKPQGRRLLQVAAIKLKNSGHVPLGPLVLYGLTRGVYSLCLFWLAVYVIVTLTPRTPST